MKVARSSMRIIITNATGVVGAEVFAQTIEDPAGLGPDHSLCAIQNTHRLSLAGSSPQYGRNSIAQMSDSIYGRMIRFLQTSNGPRGPLEQPA
jgi:hypothetical protein